MGRLVEYWWLDESDGFRMMTSYAFKVCGKMREPKVRFEVHFRLLARVLGEIVRLPDRLAFEVPNTVLCPN